MNNRREFISGAICAGITPLCRNGSARLLVSEKQVSLGVSKEAVRLLGVPLRSGSLYPGTENDAKGYRDAGLMQILHDAGIQALDDGELELPSYLPHHSIPPIRNWPGPRVVWDLVCARVEQYLQVPGSLPVLLGCDCSIVVGTARALSKLGGAHIIYIDGDFDDAPPDAAKTRSAAALAVWLLTNKSPFYFPLLSPEQVTVVGWTSGPFAGSSNVGSISLKDIRERGPADIIHRLLQRIPESTNILVHLDIDVVRQRDLPAAYFPHTEGLSLQEAGDIIDSVLCDKRVRLLEISEYATLRDANGESAIKIGRLLSHGLAQRAALRLSSKGRV